MSKGRLEAFSDGVIAIIITIMVLEMKTPAGADLVALRGVMPVFVSYVLSFVFVGIYHFAAWPVALYGAVLLCTGIAYFILTRALIAHHGQESPLATALGRDIKGKVSLVFYAMAIPVSFVNTWLACALYVVVAIMWLVPDRRIEEAVTRRNG